MIWVRKGKRRPVLWAGSGVVSRARALSIFRFRVLGDGSKGNQMSSKTTRFEKLLEAVPDSLVGMDQKGVIRFVNRQTESLFGYDRDQLIGQRIEMLVPEPLWQIYTEHRDDYFADLRARSSGLDLVLSGRHADGGEFPVNISLSHIDTGDVLLVITAVGDVAKQKLAVKTAQLLFG